MSTQPAKANSSITLRRAEAKDIEPCGLICYEAFRSIAEKHNFPPDVPSPEVGSMIVGMMFNNPGFWCVVAEAGGRMVGSNCLDERNTISGIGPITVDPKAQDGGIGRKLMEAAIARSDERNFPGVRLVQAGYHMRSLSLYTKLGFVSREQLVVVQGVPQDGGAKRYTVRPMTEADADECDALCANVHGFHRGQEIRDALAMKFAFVAERDGAIRAYTSALGFFGHTVGQTSDAICALLAQAPHPPSPGILIPTRNYELFRWCLDHGMHATMTMTLMSRGLYQNPDGQYLPSISY